MMERVSSYVAAEFQLPTPIVPTRSTYFARYSKKHADGICANADKTIRSSHPIQLMRFHCRPSGCLIEETGEQLQVLEQQKSTGLTYWQKESRRMKRIDSEGNRLAKLVNEMDTIVAHTLDDMGNGVTRGKVQTQPSNSSNTQLANHGKLNGDKCGNTGHKITGIPRKNLSKLVKHFSDGLKNSQDTLIQIASLPPPPSILLEPIYTMERFKGIIRVNSACTINPSSVQVRDYFRKEEALRYQMPERAFSYTALDGKKSTVGPLVKCCGRPSKSCGRPSNKAREHNMLKYHRPPTFTVVCLVRDAASRLPGRIGTKADIFVLVKDSQYIEGNVCETQLAGVVSAALKCLHSERDPCIKFDKLRNLWVYLHGDKEDEDFEHESAAFRKRMKWNQEGSDAYR